MNLAYKKILGKFTKVLGFGKTPPHVGKNSQIISFFFESVPKMESKNLKSPWELFEVNDVLLNIKSNKLSISNFILALVLNCRNRIFRMLRVVKSRTKQRPSDFL